VTTTNNSNASKLTPPPALSVANAGNTHADATVQIFFRQSSDAANFVITPVLMHPADANRAVNTFPYEYSRDGTTWAAWPTSPSIYNNVSQNVAGRGRLKGASLPAD